MLTFESRSLSYICELPQLTPCISCSLSLKKSYKMLKMVPGTAERCPPSVISMEKKSLRQPTATSPGYELLVFPSVSISLASRFPHFDKPKAPEVQDPKHPCLPIPPSRSTQSIRQTRSPMALSRLEERICNCAKG